MNAPLHTASRIRELNDLFRTCFIGGRVLIREAEKIRRTVEQKYARKLREDRRRAKRGER